MKYYPLLLLDSKKWVRVFFYKNGYAISAIPSHYTYNTLSLPIIRYYIKMNKNLYSNEFKIAHEI